MVVLQAVKDQMRSWIVDTAKNEEISRSEKIAIGQFAADEDEHEFKMATSRLQYNLGRW
jgi:hypothetical protein